MQRFTRSELALCTIPLVIIVITAWYLSHPDFSATSTNEPQGYALSVHALPGAASPTTGDVPSIQKPQVDPERPALRPLAPPPSIADIRSPLADRLLADTNTGVQDVAIVYRLLEHYREAFGSFPTAEDNPTIVNALTGNNPRRLAFIEREHPAINVHGELIDRWKTPLFFHMESRDALDVRSAGPDREMFSPDDVRHQSPSLRAAKE